MSLNFDLDTRRMIFLYLFLLVKIQFAIPTNQTGTMEHTCSRFCRTPRHGGGGGVEIATWFMSFCCKLFVRKHRVKQILEHLDRRLKTNLFLVIKTLYF